MIVNLLLLVSGAVLFALSNPGFLFTGGIGFFAWFAYIPVFILVRRSSWKTVWLNGGLYGLLSYALYGSWLPAFSVQAAAASFSMYFVFMALVFTAMKAAFVLCGKYGGIAAAFVFCAFEYLKTLGFTGFSYGVSAYTQWKNSSVAGMCAVTGVWGLSALIIFCSALSASVICSIKGKVSIKSLSDSVKKHIIPFFVWALCFCASLVMGNVSGRNVSSYASVKVAAVQNNTDPWKNGPDAYEKDIAVLEKLTDKALAENSDIKLVVWPETAVVPSIMLNYNTRRDRRRFEIIKQLLEYINSKNAVFVIGNFHSVPKENDSEDYNCAFVFTPGKNVIPPEPELYAKVHLVPFTEYFPYEKQFPHIYKMLLEGDTHLWTPGKKYTVFNAAGLSFSTPVCFEDTFGNGARKMVNNGACAFVNISNDAWSKSASCQNQHLAMAVFRSIENRVPSVRSTASGQTCIIDCSGKIIAQTEPFTQSYCTGNIPVIPNNAGKTVYTVIGDLFGILFTAASAVFLTVGAVCACLKRKRAHYCAEM